MLSKHLRPRRTPLLALAALPLALALAGCGKGKGTVSGKVTLDGDPLPAGRILFVGDKGEASADIKDGQYTANNVPTGNVKVAVDTAVIRREAQQLLAAAKNQRTGEAPEGMPAEAKAKFEQEKKAAEERGKRGNELMEKYRDIPEKYTKPDSSGFTVQVKKGETTTFEVPLKSK
jgi:hypothetical protein